MDNKNTGTWAPQPPLKKDPMWEEASRDVNLDNPVPYQPTQTFPLGTVIAHPKFGTGIVRGLKPGGKIIVVFPDGVRKLQAKA